MWNSVFGVAPRVPFLVERLEDDVSTITQIGEELELSEYSRCRSCRRFEIPASPAAGSFRGIKSTSGTGMKY
jgi:hypothetical protein